MFCMYMYERVHVCTMHTDKYVFMSLKKCLKAYQIGQTVLMLISSCQIRQVEETTLSS